MRRVRLLLEQARRESDNESPTSTSGISDLELVQYINDAQDKLQSVITKTHPKVFIKEGFLDVTSNTESVTLPSDILLGNRIHMVEYLYSGSSDYIRLPQRGLEYRDSSAKGDPAYYMRRSGTILLNPVPNTSKTNGLRINYQYRLRDLDVRRGIISSVSMTGTTLNSMTLNLTPSLAKDSDIVAAGADVLNSVDYVSVVDSDGVNILQSIPIDSYDETTGVVTVSSGFTTTVASGSFTGGYVVAGSTATTHSDLPDFCERFLVAYVAWKLLKRDASTEAGAKEDELMSMGRDIVDSFAIVDDDIIEIPITHPEWLI